MHPCDCPNTFLLSWFASLKNTSLSFIFILYNPDVVAIIFAPLTGWVGTSRFHSLLPIGRPPPKFLLLGFPPSQGVYPKHQPPHYTTSLLSYYFIAFHFLILHYFPPRGQRFLFPLLSPSSQEISFLVHLVVSLKNTTLSHTPLPATGPSLVVGSHHPTRQPFG